MTEIIFDKQGIISRVFCGKHVSEVRMDNVGNVHISSEKIKINSGDDDGRLDR